MMNPNEKRVSRIGWALCAVAALCAGPLVWAATRPVVPVAQGPSVPEAVPAVPGAQRTIVLPTVEIVSTAPPKARPAQAKAKPRGPRRCEREDLIQGSGSVVWCHG